MRAIVDTNVVAYYLLDTHPFAEEARTFWREVEAPAAPAMWEAELANVVWMSVRTGVFTLAEGHRRLGLAAKLGIQSVANRRLWRGALTRATTSGAAVYDTLFVELAARRRLPLATFDRKVLQAFPGIAKRPGTLVSRQ